MARSRAFRRCDHCGALVAATLKGRILLALKRGQRTNPELATQLRASGDAVRRTTRELVGEHRIRIVRYRHPYVFGLLRK